MKNILLPAVLFLALSLFTIAADAPANQPAAGTAAPDFSLTSGDGNAVSLKDYRGKWIVLYFYPKDFTSGCTLEAHNFQRDSAKYQQANAVVVGVSVDSSSSHKEFCAKQGLTFKLLADTEKKVSQQYDSFHSLLRISARNTFLIDPSGKIAKVWTGVSPSKHSEEVLAALNEASRK